MMIGSVSLLLLAHKQRKHGNDNDNQDCHHQNYERAYVSRPARRHRWANHPQLRAKLH